MRLASAVVSVLWFAGIVSSGAIADDVPIDGKTCFCLQHVATQQLLRSCIGFKGRNDFFATARCVDSESGASRPVTVDETWSLVSEGEPNCDPCRPEARGTDSVPRGEEDDDATDSGDSR